MYALWSPAGKGLTSWWCLTVSLPLSIGILGQVWYLIASIPDLCNLTLFKTPTFVGIIILMTVRKVIVCYANSFVCIVYSINFAMV